MDEKKNKLPKKTTYEKPVSLAGVSFNEVVGALLKTPKPKKENNDNQKES